MKDFQKGMLDLKKEIQESIEKHKSSNDPKVDNKIEELKAMEIAAECNYYFCKSTC